MLIEDFGLSLNWSLRVTYYVFSSCIYLLSHIEHLLVVLWRICTICICSVRKGRIPHICGGLQHWMFYHTVFSRLMN